MMNVPKSKTDQLRWGNEIVITQGLSHLTCPVAILRRYISEIERFPVDLSLFVLRPLSKRKSGHKLVSVN